MIEIRIRHQDDWRSVRLMDWPSGGLDDVIPTLLRWGVSSDNSDGDSVCGTGNDHLLSGQFRHDGPAAYFEIIIHEE